MYNLVSFLGGSAVATSRLTRRSIKGRSTVCSFLITFSFPDSSDKLNHWSNCSASPKMSGIRKLSNAQSSRRLFCKGVPVISRRNPVFITRTAWLSEEFSFLIRWASSMMRYFHSTLESLPFSFKSPSYDVTRTSHLNFPVAGSTGKSSLTNFWRSALVPPMRMALMEGHHFLNSLIQFPTTDLGTITRWGPLVPRDSRIQARKEIVCNVFPKPISSAKIPLIPLQWSLMSQFSPSSW